MEQTEQAGLRLDAGTEQTTGQAGTAAPLVKTIRWNGSAWECEPLRVRVYLPVGETQREIPIAPKDILLQDERQWLRITGVEKQDNRNVVAVGLRQGVAIAPEDSPVLRQAGVPSATPICRIVTTTAKPEPPKRVPEDKCLLTVMVADPTGTVALSPPSTGLSDGTVPLGGGPDGLAIDTGGKITLTREIVYRVEPPAVIWMRPVGMAMRLSGKPWSFEDDPTDPAGIPGPSPMPVAGGSLSLDDLSSAANRALGDEEVNIAALEHALTLPSGVFRLETGLLPPGWSDNASIDVSLTESARSLKLSIAHIQGTTGDQDSLTAYVKLDSGLLCMQPQNTLDDPGSTKPNVFPELALVTTSPALGRQVDRHVPLRAQALEVALYLCTLPLDRNTWEPAATRVHTKENAVAVIPDGRTANPPSICQMALELRLFDDWPIPDVRWSLSGGPDAAQDAAPSLNDTVTPKREQRTIYCAPSSKSWKDGGSPAIRTLVCAINAPDDKSRDVPGHEAIYSALVMEAVVNIAERPRKVRLKVTLGPTALQGKTPVNLDLGDPALKDLLIRVFHIDIDFV